MKADKIKGWARIGQATFWLFQFFYAGYELQYEEFESAGTMAVFLALICFIL